MKVGVWVSVSLPAIMKFDLILCGRKIMPYLSKPGEHFVVVRTSGKRQAAAAASSVLCELVEPFTCEDAIKLRPVCIIIIDLYTKTALNFRCTIERQAVE